MIGGPGPCASFASTVAIIPLVPDGREVIAGKFPAMSETVAFHLRD